MSVARRNQAEVVQTARFKVNFNDAGIASGVGKQTLPKGALIIGTDVFVTTVFNAGTTNVFVVGTTAAGVDLVGTADVTEGTAGVYQNIKANASTSWVPLPADTQIFATYTQTGTAATTGAAYVIVKFVVDNDLNIGA